MHKKFLTFLDFLFITYRIHIRQHLNNLIINFVCIFLDDITASNVAFNNKPDNENDIRFGKKIVNYKINNFLYHKYIIVFINIFYIFICY